MTESCGMRSDAQNSGPRPFDELDPGADHPIDSEEAVLAFALDPGVSDGTSRLLNLPAACFTGARRDLRDAIDRATSGGRPDSALVASELRSGIKGLPRLAAAVGVLHRVELARYQPDVVERHASILLRVHQARRETELRAAVSRAATSHEQDAAIAALREFHAGVVTAGTTRYSWAELEALDLPPRDQIVSDYLDAEGVLMLVAESGVGKTWGALHLLASAAFGFGTWFDRPVLGGVRRGLFVAGEDTVRRLKTRLRKIADSRGLEPTDALTAAWPRGPAAALASPSGLAWLAHELEVSRAKVCVLDNITALCVGMDIKDDGQVSTFLRSLHALRDRFGVAFVLAHHTRKRRGDGSRDESADVSFGSHVWRSLADGQVRLEREDSPRGWIIVRHDKSKDDETLTPRLFEFVKETAEFEFRGELGKRPEEGDSRRKVTVARLREALSPVGATRTKTELLDALSCADSTFRAHLKEWRAALGDELQEVPGRGQHGQNSYRLRPLEERAAASNTEARS